MAMNLRLDPDRQHALAEEARRTHRSQTDVIRDALDAYLNDSRARSRRERQALIDAGKIIPAAEPYERVTPFLPIDDDWDWAVEREDRI